MQIADIKIGDVLRFGLRDWFKAAEYGVFLSVASAGTMPFGVGDRNATDPRAQEIVVHWLNSRDEEFDPGLVECLGGYYGGAYRRYRNGYLYQGFTNEELATMVENVRLPYSSEVFGDNKFPLFKKVGVRIRNEWSYRPYWLGDNTGGSWRSIVAGNGTSGVAWATRLVDVRPVISLEPSTKVARAGETLTPYSSKPKRLFELDLNAEVFESAPYTEEDIASLFTLA